MNNRDMRHILHNFHVCRVVINSQSSIEGFEKIGNVSHVHLKTKTIETRLNEYSRSSRESFSESRCLVGRASIPDLYRIRTSKPLHSLFTGVSKLFKHWIFENLSSQTIKTRTNGLLTLPSMFSSVKTSVLRGFNSVLSGFQKYYIVPGMKVDFSKNRCPHRST